MIKFVETFSSDGTMTLAPDWLTQIHIHDRAEKMARFEEEFKRQAKRHQFPIRPFDENEAVESHETKDEFKQARELAKDAVEELTKTAFYEMNEVSPEDLAVRIEELDGRVKSQEASQHEKIECSVAHTLKHFRGPNDDDEERQAKRRAISYDSFKLAHEKKRAMFNIAMIMKKGQAAEEVTLPLRNRLRDSEFVNLPTAPLPFMSAICTLQALDLLGVKDAGLREEEGRAVFSKTTLVNKRDDIIELTNTAARASGNRIRSRVKSEKVSKDKAHEPLTKLRRMVESNFGAQIKGIRVTERTGTNRTDKTETYVVVHDKCLIELASISNAFEGDTIIDVEQRPMSDHVIEPPRKRRRADVPPVDQMQLDWTEQGLTLLN